MRSLFALLLLASPALADDPEPRQLWTVSGAVGADLPTNQLWTGVELAAHPNQDQGLAGVLLVTPAYSLSENTGLMWVEAGATIAIPNADAPEAIVRAGLVGRAAIPVVTYPLPLRLGDTGKPGVGVAPAVQALLEFGWLPKPRPDRGPEARSPGAALGIRIGPASEISAVACNETEDPDDCLRWVSGILATFYTRVDLKNGLHFEARAGTSFSLSVGRRL